MINKCVDAVQQIQVIGVVMTVGGCIWICIVTYCHLNAYLIIISAVLVGAGCAILLISAIAMATEIIGSYSVSHSYWQLYSPTWLHTRTRNKHNLKNTVLVSSEN